MQEMELWQRAEARVVLAKRGVTMVVKRIVVFVWC
jgi:hypothetical protein